MLDEGLAHHSFYASSEHLPRPASKTRQVGHVKLRFVFRTSELPMCNGLRQVGIPLRTLRKKYHMTTVVLASTARGELCTEHGG